MFKYKLFSTFIFAIAIILSSSYLCAAKIIILKDGSKIEGEVISSNLSSITVKSGDEIHTFKRIDIESVKKRKPHQELLLPPKELYKRMELRVNQDDAEAHYKLGIFCLERNLFDFAVIEFDKAKRLDNRSAVVSDAKLQKVYKAKVKGAYDIGMYYFNIGMYKKALDVFKGAVKAFPDCRLRKDFQEMIELSKERLTSSPVMTEEEIKEKLKNREFLIPYTAEMAKVINLYLVTLLKSKDDDEYGLKEYAARYLDMANSYLEVAESDMSAERWRYFRIALYCYGIASCDKDFSGEVLTLKREIKRKIDENFQNKLIIPDTLGNLKWAEAFIDELEPQSQERILSASWYYAAAKDYESRIKNKRTALSKALYCYLVLVNSFPEQPEVEKAGLYGWANCFEKLEK